MTDARLAALRKGMPGQRIISESIPSESSVAEEIEAGISAVMENIIGALAMPLTSEEERPKAKELERPSRIIFKGNLEEVNRFFYKRGWVDGLPITPPTEEAVAEILTGTDFPADHVLGKIVPRLGKATIEKIAINAVMAGALPTHMPVLMAGVKALLDPRAELNLFGVSTGSWAPFWIVNGPVRKDLHINSGAGALSPGDIANAAIGRAFGLIIKNIGGARKGLEDMGVLGNPAKYSMVLAENEENSPWEPLHVQYGFNKEDSTVTLSFPNTYIQVWPYGSDDKGILNGVLSNMIIKNGPFCLILAPTLAEALDQNGWTKKQIANFITEHGRVPGYRHPYFWGVSSGVVRKELVPIGPMDVGSIIESPELIRVVVAGGPGGYMGITVGFSMGETQWVTKKIDLPANWGQLVKKYGAIVPAYERQ
jgi:hypothetical protein